MYDYIQRKADYKLYICENNNLKTYDIPIQRLFNNLLSKELTDLSSREKQTKKNLGFKSKIPIYVNPNNLFICMKSYRSNQSMYINYFAIKNYTFKENYVCIHFHTNHYMLIKEKYTFSQQMKKCDKLLAFIK